MKPFPATAALVAALLVGCGSVPGTPAYISTSKSDFDGSTVISAHPGHVSGCCSMGAAWTSKEPQLVQLTVILMGAYTVMEGSVLELNIDGRMVKAVTTTAPTQYNPASGFRSSSRNFIINRSDLVAATSAKLLRMRVTLPSGMVEGDMLRDAYGGAAIQGLRGLEAALPK